MILNEHIEHNKSKKNQQANDDRTSLVSLPSMAHHVPHLVGLPIPCMT